ncbi:MAG: hypothetical protein K0S53_33 [Bacteroidetes bacterium]|jgi:hypothetical protein|nr:hypothetical protein [Bacteroidota bacterium]
MFYRCLIIISIFIGSQLKAVTIRTVAPGNWEDNFVWSNNQVPASPDSIIVRHYLVLNQNLTINSPTVLFVDSLGTICGEYLVETVCGASLINYGHLYLNQIKTRAGFNYHVIECKNFINISGCPPGGSGYFNSVPPNGTVSVWPPVLCKTQDTNWEIGTIGVAEFENSFLKIYPNPIKNETLTIVTYNATELKITNLIGNDLLNKRFENQTEMQLNFLPNGIYFLELIIGNQKLIKKIIKSD